MPPVGGSLSAPPLEGIDCAPVGGIEQGTVHGTLLSFMERCRNAGTVAVVDVTSSIDWE